MQAQELKRNIHRQQAEEVSLPAALFSAVKNTEATPKSLERDDTLRKGDGPVGLWWLLLIPVLILALYRAGVLSLQIATLSVGWNWGLPRWWRGQYAHLSGRLVRWFRPAGSPALRISIAGQAGSLSLEVWTGPAPCSMPGMASPPWTPGRTSVIWAPFLSAFGGGVSGGLFPGAGTVTSQPPAHRRGRSAAPGCGMAVFLAFWPNRC